VIFSGCGENYETEKTLKQDIADQTHRTRPSSLLSGSAATHAALEHIEPQPQVSHHCVLSSLLLATDTTAATEALQDRIVYP
jgi:PBP1b-binding outer membrane lipoprotein LpoB